MPLKRLPGFAAACAIAALAACTASTPPPSSIGIGYPSVSMGTRPVVFAMPSYPEALRGTGQQAAITLDCTIGADGYAHQCQAESSPTDPRFTAAALAWMATVGFNPAVANGAAVLTPHYRMTIRFEPPARAYPALTLSANPTPGPILIVPPVPMHDPGGHVVMACTIGLDGRTHDCILRSLQGNPLYAQAVLAYAQAARYLPAYRDGVQVEEPHVFSVDFKGLPAPY